ncbi:hypothetical protein HJD18_10655 [Thermoleophilia bacterium SCSIO 60948]|nr:hypothetical protein HJD18_10655 [Thermoleophilia bacterium SCSIO 60948]
MTGDPTRSSNPLRDERAMFAVLLRVMGIAGVVLLLTAIFNATVGAVAALFLVGLWIGIVVSRRRGA